MPTVQVQHPLTGAEWVRYFRTDEEAARYYRHITEERGMIACIPLELPVRMRGRFC